MTVQTAPVIAHIEAVTAHTAPAIVPIAAVNAHTEAVNAHISAVTSHEHLFGPTATAHEKMAKPIYYSKGCLFPRIHIDYLKILIFPNGVRHFFACFRISQNVIRPPFVFLKTGKGFSETR